MVARAWQNLNFFPWRGSLNSWVVRKLLGHLENSLMRNIRHCCEFFLRRFTWPIWNNLAWSWLVEGIGVVWKLVQSRYLYFMATCAFLMLYHWFHCFNQFNRLFPVRDKIPCYAFKHVKKKKKIYFFNFIFVSTQKSGVPSIRLL